MKKTHIGSLILVLLMISALFSGCSAVGEPGSSPSPEPSGAAGSPADEPESSPDETPEPGAHFQIAALKGPTAMGMVKMLSDGENPAGGNTYEAAIYGTADEISALLINGDVDVASVPCNLASVLYQKTGGAIKAAAINTLGVLYVVENGDSVRSVGDLKGKTVYSTGQGTTPEFALNYILTQNGIDPETDLNIEYKSESTEIAALLSASDDAAIAVLPQPYVTTVQLQKENVRIALNLTEEWDKVSESSALITSAVVARAGFVEENPAAFRRFMEDFRASVDYVNTNASESAALIEQYDIASAAVAEKALPFCNICFIEGDEMQTLISGYLAVLYEANPQSVGGATPDDNFFYKG